MTISNRLSSHRQPNQATELTRLRKWRKKARLLVLLCGQLTNQFLCGGLDHRIGDPPGFGGNDSKRESRKYVRVIGLGDGNLLSANIHRLERTAGADQRPSFCPIHQVLGSRFTARSGVRKREDDRPIRILRHFTHRLFGKGARLARYPDEDRRLRIAYHVEQGDLSIRLLPALHFLFFARIG